MNQSWEPIDVVRMSVSNDYSAEAGEVTAQLRQLVNGAAAAIHQIVFVPCSDK
jgi:hypothetical protein